MSTPRPEPRQHARPGRDPAREGAVVRQRLRAVTSTGRPALAWQPATAALPRVGPLDVARPGDDGFPWPDGPGGQRPDPADGSETPDLVEAVRTSRRDRVEVRGRAADLEPVDERDGWLPPRPAEHDDPVAARLDGPDAEGTIPAAGPDDEAARPRHRAARTASTAYTAAYGHPTSHSGFDPLGEEGRRRWAMRPRVAVAALAVVLLLAAGVVLLRSPADGVEPVARVGGAQADGATTATGDGATAPADGSAVDTGATGDATGPGGGGADPGTGAAPSGGVVVHVVGQVAAPGLVTVAADARVADALEAAGGATAEADLAALNLARTVTDGEQILVPRPGEAVPAAGTAPAGAGSATDATVDLNAADAATLDALPGIGPVLAERIVAWREENGPFTAVEELGEVSGIGPAVLADVRDLVRV
ncbi:ComEA family DNA-binding protein [Cellulosimicrobium cellulans]|uniref:ComEA family DNA-binding protein n=1 Tax=Cellulosimicrobium cellulans TaxID=1710 RepID=UPI0027DD6D5F|nr:helix-hairpin-helix domain-containing protein [Cellulosimicrobium cellulans]